MPRLHRTRPIMSSRKVSFDTDDKSSVKHSRIGVWDLYEQIPPRLVGWPSLQPLFDVVENLPYVWHMLVDVSSIRECNILLLAYLVIELFVSLIPALSLWSVSFFLFHWHNHRTHPVSVGILASFCTLCVSVQTWDQSLTWWWQVQTAVQHRSVDKSLLFQVASGRFLCALATRILRYTKHRLAVPLNARIKQYYSVHMFHAMARLDLPTFDDPKVQRQLESSFPQSSRSSIAWDTVTMISHIMTTVVQLASQLSVLVRVLNDQQDGPLLALLSFAEALFQRSAIREPFFHRGGKHLSTQMCKSPTLRS